MTPTEIKRTALDVSDWLWGTVKGGFNEKMTTSQIIVDAVVGMIPLVGSLTAVRDLVAVTLTLANDPKKRDDVGQWMLLVVFLFALLPVLGGVIKGVGRLLLRVTDDALAAKALKGEIVRFLNRVTTGNGLQFLKQLDFTRYQTQLLAKWREYLITLDETMGAMASRMKGWLPAPMLAALGEWQTNLRALKSVGEKMIPQAIKELNAKLKIIQHALYEGEWHTVYPGIKNTTREAEARLVEGTAPARILTKGKYPQNSLKDYVHREGWPDLRAKYNREAEKYEHISAFSGKIEAAVIKGPRRIYRVVHVVDNRHPNKAGNWWLPEHPANGRTWRERWAVLKKYNANGHILEYQIPAGRELKIWKGKASEQADEKLAQFLEGGAEQYYVAIDATTKVEMERLIPKPTNWTDLDNVGINYTPGQAYTETLSRHEIAPKTSALQTAGTAAATAGRLSQLPGNEPQPTSEASAR